MKIEYNNKSIEKICTNATIAERKYGVELAGKLQMRIDQIKAAESVEEMIQFHIGRCHSLKGNRRKHLLWILLIHNDWFSRKRAMSYRLSIFLK